MSRGVGGQDIFLDDEDRQTFARILRETKLIFGFNLFAYCLMGNHFHLLFQVSSTPLRLGMHRLLTRYSHYFNLHHAREGHLFQSRYTAPVCERDAYLLYLPRYIHLNPVRAGFVATADRWPWSGHNGLAGISLDPMLDKGAFARVAGTTEDELESQYADAFKTAESAHPESPLRELVVEAARWRGVSVSAMRTGRRGSRLTEAKLRFISSARDRGYRWSEIAAELNCSPTAAVQLRRRKSSLCA